MTAAPPRRVAAVLFALFVIGTGGAFFVTQRLKRSTPIVTRVFFQQWIGPTCHCKKSHVTLRFDLPKAQRVTVSLVNRAGETARTFADDRYMSKGRHPFVFDGRGDNGVVLPDGNYRLRVGLRAEGRSVTAPRVLHLDTQPPKPKVVAVTPPTIVPGSGGPRGRARVRFDGPTNPPAQFVVWRTDGRKPVRVASFSGRRGRHTATWDGLVHGQPAPVGSYLVAVTVADKAGNRGSAPAVLPPVRAYAARRDGIGVAYFTLTGPLVPVKPGGIARFTIGPLPRPTRWRLAKYARAGTIRSGVSHGSRIAVRIPSDADADVYSLSAESGDQRATWPLVVSDAAGGAAPVLVVLPAITWQGQNAVESNRDGWPDTLDAADAVPLARGFLRGRPPSSIATETVPILDFLEHIRANYDLTTDVALAAGKDPSIAGHNGVVFAGSERWITPKLNLQLRHFVAGGGTVASFGEDALRRGVELSHGMLVDPTSRRAKDVFGERTKLVTTSEAPLVVSQDKLGLFSGSDNYVGSFTSLERSLALPANAGLLTQAGRADPVSGNVQPDFVAYSFGKGLVIRSGTGQWPAALTSSPELANATRKMWTLLSR